MTPPEKPSPPDAMGEAADTGLPARHHLFRPHDALDWVFLISIVAKGHNGLTEVIGGVLLLFVTPNQIHRLVLALTQHELNQDPRDALRVRVS